MAVMVELTKVRHDSGWDWPNIPDALDPSARDQPTVTHAPPGRAYCFQCGNGTERPRSCSSDELRSKKESSLSVYGRVPLDHKGSNTANRMGVPYSGMPYIIMLLKEK